MITRLVIGPNASLSGAQAWGFLGVTALIALGTAAMFALRGYWPILPFAGLELVALGAALWVTQRRNRYREVLSFTESVIRIEFGLIGQGASASAELPRAWTKVTLAGGPHRNDPTRLGLDYCGQRITIGRCLTDDDRERLAARIRELLRPAWQASRAAPAEELTLGES
ncbi:MAG TPA: DUF2244 domain-containing protein [Nevskiaceae bacterium]|nr:DUF2244 domain-containing protein [Nevskiaceae bacterium]